VISVSDIRRAAERLSGRVVRTPLLESPMLNKHASCSLYVKAEPLQKTGAFKFRGALYAQPNQSWQQPRAPREASARTPRKRARSRVIPSSALHALVPGADCRGEQAGAKDQIVVVARKLAIVLWRFVELGLVPESAILSPRVTAKR
jgi:hypothetical protein